MDYRPTSLDRKITAFTVNLFYKILYDEAVEDFRANRGGSISSSYRNIIHSCVEGLKSGEHQNRSYKTLIQNINGMFTKTDATHTVSNLMQKITYEFVPSELAHLVEKDRQNALMFDVIVGLFDKMKVACLAPEVFELLVDSRGSEHDRENEIMLSEICFNHLNLKRAEIMQKFLTASRRGGEEQEEMISKSIAEEIQKRLWDCEKQLREKESHIQSLETALRNANQQVRLLIQNYRELRDKTQQPPDYYSIVEEASAPVETSVEEEPAAKVEEPEISSFELDLPDDQQEPELVELPEISNIMEEPKKEEKPKRKKKRIKKAGQNDDSQIDTDPFGAEM
jgi:hypothetical protein